MNRIRRISRLVKHYKRIRDEKAGELADSESKAMQKRRDIEDVRKRHRAAGAFLVAGDGNHVDVTIARMAGAYKAHLVSELKRQSAELRSIEVDVEGKRRATTKAYREQKVWEIVKDKLEVAEDDYAIYRSQKELDELAQQKKHHRQTGVSHGTNRRRTR